LAQACAITGNMQAFYDGMTLVGSLVVMAAVIALAYYASRWYAGRMTKTVSGKHIKLVDRISLGVGSSAVVLQAGEKYYLVGVSDKNIQLICELEDFEPASPAEQNPQVPFGRLLSGFISKDKAKSKAVNAKDDGTDQ
jgi:flagellar biosynthetic protein FliO